MIVALIPEDALAGVLGFLIVAVIALYRDHYKLRERVASLEEYRRLRNGPDRQT